MPCEMCEKRIQDEKKSLSDCKGKCEELNAKAHRLALVVAVLSTLVGKETLDMALGLSSTIDQIAATPEPEESTPTTVAVHYPDRPHKYTEVKRSAPLATPEVDILFPDLPPLLPDLGRQYDVYSYEHMYIPNHNYAVPEVGILPLMILSALPRRRRRK